MTKEYAVYTLKSGKIHRLDEDGKWKSHPAPYDFVPTPGELSGNKDRMVASGTVTDSDPQVAAMKMNLGNSPASVQPATAPAPARDPFADIAEETSIETLDALFSQETAQRKPRKKLLEAIEARRAELTAKR